MSSASNSISQISNHYKYSLQKFYIILHINLIRKRNPHQYSVLTLNSISPTHTSIPFLKSLKQSNIFEKISYFNSIFLQTGKTPNKHGNSGQFPCLYHIPRFSTAFSVKLIHFSPKSNNILLLFTFPFYTITETPDFCVKVYFCLIVRFFPQSPCYQRHTKTRKSGVHQPLR